MLVAQWLMSGGNWREVGRMQIMKLFLGHGKDFGMYSECNGEPWTCFKAGEFVGLIYILTGFPRAPV